MTRHISDDARDGVVAFMVDGDALPEDLMLRLPVVAKQRTRQPVGDDGGAGPWQRPLRRALHERERKDVEKVGAGVVGGLPEAFVANRDDHPLVPRHMGDGLDLGIRLHRLAEGPGRPVQRMDLALHIHVAPHAVDLVAVLEEAIVAPLILHPQQDEKTRRQPHRQPRDVDERIPRLLSKIAERNLEIVLEHREPPGDFCRELMLAAALAPVDLLVFARTTVEVAHVIYGGAEGSLVAESLRLLVGDVVAEVALEFVEVIGEEGASVGVELPPGGDGFFEVEATHSALLRGRA